MSYFGRSLIRASKSILKPPTKFESLIGWIDDKIHKNFIADFYHKLQWVWLNRWLLKWVWNWRSYSAETSVELFAESLMQMGRHQRDGGLGITDKKHGRRAIAAGKTLHKLYTEDYNWNDKSFTKWAQDNPLKFTREGGIVRTYKQSKKFCEKMGEVIKTRLEKEESQAKREIWAKIEKNIPYWGD